LFFYDPNIKNDCCCVGSFVIVFFKTAIFLGHFFPLPIIELEKRKKKNGGEKSLSNPSNISHL